MRRPTLVEAASLVATAISAAASVATLLQYMNVPPEQAASALGGWFYQYAPLICLLGGFTFGASVSYLVTRGRNARRLDAALEEAERRHGAAMAAARSELEDRLAEAERRASAAVAERDEALSQKAEREAERARTEREAAESRERAFEDRVRHMPIKHKTVLVGLLERGEQGLVLDEYDSDRYMDELSYEGLASWETTSSGKRWRATEKARDLAESHPELLDEARAAYKKMTSEG